MKRNLPLILILTICWIGTTYAVAGSKKQAKKQTLPTWAEEIRESVSRVPPVAVETPRWPATPGTWSLQDGAVPRGVPRELTKRIETPAPSTPQPRSARPSGTSRPEGTPAAPPPAPVPSTPRSTLEQLYLGSFDRNPDRQLEQFGYSYFEEVQEADEVGPVPEDYVIGPGDEIVITAWGSFEAFHRLTVERDGRVTVPEVGALPIAGRSFGELLELVRRAYGERRKSFEVSVAMGRLRRIRVHVVGHVVRPGLTEVPSRANALSGLIAAGGPDKAGSLRRIELRRDGKSQTFDLYDFLVHGQPAGDMLLQTGDVIFVPSIGPTVGVAGFVQRPAIYESLDTVTVDEAITIAGGLTPFTFTPQVQIERTVNGRGRATFDVGLDDSGRATVMGDGELLLIGAVDDRMQPVVRVSGQVVRPGKFQYRAGMRVADLIQQADGLNIDAYLHQAFISRQVGSPGPVELVPQRLHMASTRRILVVDLALALDGHADHDIELMPLDHLEVRSRQQATVRPTVTVLGPVQQPGTYELTTGLKVSELVAMAGNVRPEVYYDEAELIRRVYDSATRQLDVGRFRFDLGRALDGSPDDDFILQNGDQIVIRALRSAQVTVEIEGEVRFPGPYVFPAGASITDLITAAGGLLPAADMRAAFFSRESVRKQQQKRLEQLVEITRRRFEAVLEKMTKNGQPRESLAAKLSLEQTQELLSRMASQQSGGRVIIPFLRDDFPTSPFNLTLENADRIFIPRRQETVAVLGHVFNPSTFVVEDDLTVGDVLERSGGITEYGDDRRSYVVRADGNIERHRGSRRSWKRVVLHAGDSVLVPRASLERSFGAKLSDALKLARQAAEVGLLFDYLGAGGARDLTTVLQPMSEAGIAGYEEGILDR